MNTNFRLKNNTFAFKTVCALMALLFTVDSVLMPGISYAQLFAGAQQAMPLLPAPGVMVSPSPRFNPAIINGLSLDPKNPLQLDFIIDTGDDHLQAEALRAESQKLVQYFMAALTVPGDELWVNLSPYEENRVIANGLSQTAMGRDMLSQDYLLKQLSASLMYPENEPGERFWRRINKQMWEKYGVSEIPTDVFNKIWIVPEKAQVFLHNNTVFITKSRLKVMMEEDYLALEHHDRGLDVHASAEPMKEDLKALVREIILPEIEREVNEGKNFASLRQMYHSLILARWYKKNLKESVLGRVYAGQNKVDGVAIEEKGVKEKIYRQYIEAFKQGVYDYIKEEYDPATQDVIPRKYFSGGADFARLSVEDTNEPVSLLQGLRRAKNHVAVTVQTQITRAQSDTTIPPKADRAMVLKAQWDLQERLTAEGNDPDDIEKLSRFIRESLEGKPLILELGAGNTEAARALAKTNRDTNVIAADQYDPMDSRYQVWTEQFQSRELKSRQDNLVVVKVSLDLVSYLPDNTLDALVMVNPDKETGVSVFSHRWLNTVRRLKPGGEVVIKPFGRYGQSTYHPPGYSLGAPFINIGTEYYGVRLEDYSYYKTPDRPLSSDPQRHLKQFGSIYAWKKPSDAAMLTEYRPERINDIPFTDVTEVGADTVITSSMYKDFEKLGKDKYAVDEALKNADRTLGMFFGLNGSDANPLYMDYREMVVQELQKLIQSKKSQKDFDVTIYQFGIGGSENFLETRQILSALEAALLRENVPLKRQQQWNVKLIAADINENYVEKFHKKFREAFYFKADLKVVKVDALDRQAIERLGQRWKADFIFNRNTTYGNKEASYQGFRTIDGKLLPDKDFIKGVLSVYLSTANLLRYLAGENSIYVIEGPQDTQWASAFHIPGLTMRKVTDYEEDHAKNLEERVHYLGVGIYEVQKPHSLHEKGVEFFVRNINENGKLDPISAGKASTDAPKADRAMRADVPSHIRSIRRLNKRARQVAQAGHDVMRFDVGVKKLIKMVQDNPTYRSRENIKAFIDALVETTLSFPADNVTGPEIKTYNVVATATRALIGELEDIRYTRDMNLSIDALIKRSYRTRARRLTLDNLAKRLKSGLPVVIPPLRSLSELEKLQTLIGDLEISFNIMKDTRPFIFAVRGSSHSTDSMAIYGLFYQALGHSHGIDPQTLEASDIDTIRTGAMHEINMVNNSFILSFYPGRGFQMAWFDKQLQDWRYEYKDQRIIAQHLVEMNLIEGLSDAAMTVNLPPVVAEARDVWGRSEQLGWLTEGVIHRGLRQGWINWDEQGDEVLKRRERDPLSYAAMLNLAIDLGKPVDLEEAWRHLNTAPHYYVGVVVNALEAGWPDVEKALGHLEYRTEYYTKVALKGVEVGALVDVDPILARVHNTYFAAQLGKKILGERNDQDFFVLIDKVLDLRSLVHPDWIAELTVTALEHQYDFYLNDILEMLKSQPEMAMRVAMKAWEAGRHPPVWEGLRELLAGQNSLILKQKLDLLGKILLDASPLSGKFQEIYEGVVDVVDSTPSLRDAIPEEYHDHIPAYLISTMVMGAQNFNWFEDNIQRLAALARVSEEGRLAALTVLSAIGRHTRAEFQITDLDDLKAIEILLKTLLPYAQHYLLEHQRTPKDASGYAALNQNARRYYKGILSAVMIAPSGSEKLILSKIEEWDAQNNGLLWQVLSIGRVEFPEKGESYGEVRDYLLRRGERFGDEDLDNLGSHNVIFKALFDKGNGKTDLEHLGMFATAYTGASQLVDLIPLHSYLMTMAQTAVPRDAAMVSSYMHIIAQVEKQLKALNPIYGIDMENPDFRKAFLEGVLDILTKGNGATLKLDTASLQNEDLDISLFLGNQSRLYGFVLNTKLNRDEEIVVSMNQKVALQDLKRAIEYHMGDHSANGDYSHIFRKHFSWLSQFPEKYLRDAGQRIEVRLQALKGDWAMTGVELDLNGQDFERISQEVQEMIFKEMPDYEPDEDMLYVTFLALGFSELQFEGFLEKIRARYGTEIEHIYLYSRVNDLVMDIKIANDAGGEPSETPQTDEGTQELQLIRKSVEDGLAAGRKTQPKHTILVDEMPQANQYSLKIYPAISENRADSIRRQLPPQYKMFKRTTGSGKAYYVVLKSISPDAAMAARKRPWSHHRPQTDAAKNPLFTTAPLEVYRQLKAGTIRAVHSDVTLETLRKIIDSRYATTTQYRDKVLRVLKEKFLDVFSEGTIDVMRAAFLLIMLDTAAAGLDAQEKDAYRQDKVDVVALHTRMIIAFQFLERLEPEIDNEKDRALYRRVNSSLSEDMVFLVDQNDPSHPGAIDEDDAMAADVLKKFKTLLGYENFVSSWGDWRRNTALVTITALVAAGLSVAHVTRPVNLELGDIFGIPIASIEPGPASEFVDFGARLAVYNEKPYIVSERVNEIKESILESRGQKDYDIQYWQDVFSHYPEDEPVTAVFTPNVFLSLNMKNPPPAFYTALRAEPAFFGRFLAEISNIQGGVYYGGYKGAYFRTLAMNMPEQKNEIFRVVYKEELRKLTNAIGNADMYQVVKNKSQEWLTRLCVALGAYSSTEVQTLMDGLKDVFTRQQINALMGIPNDEGQYEPTGRLMRLIDLVQDIGGIEPGLKRLKAASIVLGPKFSNGSIDLVNHFDASMELMRDYAGVPSEYSEGQRGLLSGIFGKDVIDEYFYNVEGYLPLVNYVDVFKFNEVMDPDGVYSYLIDFDGILRGDYFDRSADLVQSLSYEQAMGAREGGNHDWVTLNAQARIHMLGILSQFPRFRTIEREQYVLAVLEIIGRTKVSNYYYDGYAAVELAGGYSIDHTVLSSVKGLMLGTLAHEIDHALNIRNDATAEFFGDISAFALLQVLGLEERITEVRAGFGSGYAYNSIAQAYDDSRRIMRNNYWNDMDAWERLIWLLEIDDIEQHLKARIQIKLLEEAFGELGLSVDWQRMSRLKGEVLKEYGEAPFADQVKALVVKYFDLSPIKEKALLDVPVKTKRDIIPEYELVRIIQAATLSDPAMGTKRKRRKQRPGSNVVIANIFSDQRHAELSGLPLDEILEARQISYLRKRVLTDQIGLTKGGRIDISDMVTCLGCAVVSADESIGGFIHLSPALDRLNMDHYKDSLRRTVKAFRRKTNAQSSFKGARALIMIPQFTEALLTDFQRGILRQYAMLELAKQRKGFGMFYHGSVMTEDEITRRFIEKVFGSQRHRERAQARKFKIAELVRDLGIDNIAADTRESWWAHPIRLTLSDLKLRTYANNSFATVIDEVDIKNYQEVAPSARSTVQGASRPVQLTRGIIEEILGSKVPRDMIRRVYDSASDKSFQSNQEMERFVEETYVSLRESDKSSGDPAMAAERYADALITPISDVLSDILGVVLRQEEWLNIDLDSHKSLKRAIREALLDVLSHKDGHESVVKPKVVSFRTMRYESRLILNSEGNILVRFYDKAGNRVGIHEVSMFTKAVLKDYQAVLEYAQARKTISLKRFTISGDAKKRHEMFFRWLDQYDVEQLKEFSMHIEARLRRIEMKERQDLAMTAAPQNIHEPLGLITAVNGVEVDADEMVRWVDEKYQDFVGGVKAKGGDLVENLMRSLTMDKPTRDDIYVIANIVIDKVTGEKYLHLHSQNITSPTYLFRIKNYKGGSIEVDDFLIEDRNGFVPRSYLAQTRGGIYADQKFNAVLYEAVKRFFEGPDWFVGYSWEDEYKTKLRGLVMNFLNEQTAVPISYLGKLVSGKDIPIYQMLRDRDAHLGYVNAEFGVDQEVQSGEIITRSALQTKLTYKTILNFEFDPEWDHAMAGKDTRHQTPDSRIEELADLLTSHYESDKDKAARLVEQLRGDGVREKSEERKGGTYTLLMKDGQRLVEISPLGSKRFFDTNERWIMTVDPHGNKMEELHWDQDDKLEKVWFRNGNRNSYVVQTDESGMLSALYRLDDDDKVKPNEYVLIFRNTIQHFGEKPYSVKSASFKQRGAVGQSGILPEDRGAPVIFLNILSQLSEDQHQKIHYTGVSTLDPIFYSLFEVARQETPFDIAEFDPEKTWIPIPGERMFNASLNDSNLPHEPLYMTLRHGELLRIFYEGQNYLNHKFLSSFYSGPELHNTIEPDDKSGFYKIVRNGVVLAHINNKGNVLSEDAAMTADKGGIDFNPKNLDIKETGHGFRFHVNPELDHILPESVQTIVPVIINITPITSLPLLLGLSMDEAQKLASKTPEKSYLYTSEN